MLFGPPLTILILSPQPWAGLQMSKHHYARELAALGHHIYFAQPPGGAGSIKLTPAHDPAGAITIVDYPKARFSRLKFHARAPFDLLMRRRARQIAAAIGPIDLLWDFDNVRQFADHRWFGATTSILHLMDRPSEGDRLDRNAGLIVGVAPALIEVIRPYTREKHLIGHGLSALFAAAARKRLATPPTRDPDAPVRIGFIGNLAQTAIDHDRTLALMAEQRSAIFRFIGPVQGETPAVRAWVEQLRAEPNVELTGLLTGDALIDATVGIDIWLLCYDAGTDVNGAVNSHKLLEYFALGGEVVSSYIAAQAEAPGIFMAPLADPAQIHAKLAAAIAAVKNGDDTGSRQRAEMALGQSYSANVTKINALLAASGARQAT